MKNMNFKRKLPIPMETKEMYPVTREVAEIVEQRTKRRLGVEQHDRRVVGGALVGCRVLRYRYLVAARHGGVFFLACSVEQNGRLAFVARRSANAQQGGNGIEQATC